ncbi:hypothetical protein U1Q18_017874 [Sarracenia purpurea var. burkii]
MLDEDVDNSGETEAKAENGEGGSTTSDLQVCSKTGKYEPKTSPTEPGDAVEVYGLVPQVRDGNNIQNPTSGLATHGAPKVFDQLPQPDIKWIGEEECYPC